ncbi:MAG TPA: PEGA domain-containing protein [Longimicrobium sp.]|nr:PEGA domain-containing protein [Longimicrobium sp.]
MLALLLAASTAHGQEEADDLLAPLTPVEKKSKRKKKDKDAQQQPVTEENVPAGKALLSVNLFTTGGGARLLIDGEDMGVLLPGDPPRPVTPGSHKVQVQRRGYKDFVLTVPAQAGKVVQIPVSLEPVAGVVSVDSDPSGADVLVDGVKVGVTPMNEMLLSPGHHELRIRREGYTSNLQVLSVRAGKDYEVRAKLEAGSDRPERDRLMPGAQVAEGSSLPGGTQPTVTATASEGGAWYTQWYVWAGVGAVAAAATAGVVVATQPRPLTSADVCGAPGCHTTINGQGIRF